MAPGKTSSSSAARAGGSRSSSSARPSSSSSSRSIQRAPTHQRPRKNSGVASASSSSSRQDRKRPSPDVVPVPEERSHARSSRGAGTTGARSRRGAAISVDIEHSNIVTGKRRRRQAKCAYFERFGDELRDTLLKGESRKGDIAQIKTKLETLERDHASGNVDGDEFRRAQRALQRKLVEVEKEERETMAAIYADDEDLQRDAVVELMREIMHREKRQPGKKDQIRKQWEILFKNLKKKGWRSAMIQESLAEAAQQQAEASDDDEEEDDDFDGDDASNAAADFEHRVVRALDSDYTSDDDFDESAYRRAARRDDAAEERAAAELADLATSDDEEDDEDDDEDEEDSFDSDEAEFDE